MSDNQNSIKYAVGAAAALFMGYFAYKSMGSAAPSNTKTITYEEFQKALPKILEVIPKEWDGTTYKNSNLLGRQSFSNNFIDLLASSVQNNKPITESDLINIGNAEDYFRVSSNISSVYETALALKHKRSVEQVFSFSSSAMPIFSVMMISGSKAVHLYVGDGDVNSPFTQTHIDDFAKEGGLGCVLKVFKGAAVANKDVIVLSRGDDFNNSAVDGVIDGTTLYINNNNNILPIKILQIRKRLTTPVTSAYAFGALEVMAGKINGTNGRFGQTKTNNDDIETFNKHLQQISGTESNANSYPMCFTAGLPAICSVWMSLIRMGGGDIVMASTSYGGSSELTDLLVNRTKNLRKTTFDITGKNDLVEAVTNALKKLEDDEKSLRKRVCVFIEIPTNPDMKVPDVNKLAQVLEKFKESMKAKCSQFEDLFLMVDATFAPASQCMRQVKEVAPELTTMTFISMSKSVSRGVTCAGTIIAGPSQSSCDLLNEVKATASMLDTGARQDQMMILCKEHIGVEERCQKAYAVARAVGNAVQAAVKQNCDGYEMDLAFVSESDAAKGFTTSTFSFNLPAMKGKSQKFNEDLAQKFTDLICQDPEVFKPCVSFGQDNGLVYATVPATSTQGAIKLEDKAKQAVGGVQLCRLSFPVQPSKGQAIVIKTIEDAIKKVFNQ